MHPALKTAIEYAEKGYYVFPIQPGSKYPYKGFKWKELSTKDPAKVKAAGESTRYKGCNWALDCGKSGIFILDVDSYKPEFVGADFIPGKELDTYSVKSARGGFQYYYSDPDNLGANSSNKLAPAVDTRGPGYALIPGSTFEDGVYTIKQNKSLRPIPTEIITILGKPSEKKENNDIPLVDLDQEHNIKAAIKYLQTQAPEAIEGQGGDQTTYEVACKVRDLGIGQTEAYSLMSEHWNNIKAAPPWSAHELEKKIINAYSYAKDVPGNASLDTLFPDTPRSTDIIRCAAELTIQKVKPRKWILGHRFSPGYTTLTVAPPGVGKSALSILECASVATGKKLTYDMVKDKGGVWYFNTEDPFEEIERRIISVEMRYSIALKEVKDFYYSSGYDAPAKFAALDDRGRPVANEALINNFIKAIKNRKIKLLVIDPLVKCHSLKENDNDHMDFVMTIFSRIAKATDCAIHVVHHTSKGKHNAGNADAARGASALIGAARIAHTLYTMTPKEAKEYGVLQHKSEWYIRLDKAKANMSPPNSMPQWFEKAEMRIMPKDEDTTVVLTPSELSRIVAENTDEAIAEAAINMVVTEGEKSLYAISKSIYERGMVALKDRQIGRKLEELFAIPVIIKTGTVVNEVKETSNGKPVKVLKFVKNV